MSSLEDLLFGIEHDQVIRASSSTYNPQELARLGLQITLNLTNEKNRFVGDSANPIYPEIVIWRPDFQGANTGQAVVAESIETSYSISNT